MNAIGRRHLMRMALAGAAAGAGLTATATGAHAGGPEFPDVPGMSGDRRANEFWYQFDEATFYRMTPEVRAAYDAIYQYMGDFEAGFYDTWRSMRGAPGYPGSFRSYVEPVRDALDVLSRTQLDVVDRYYRHDPRGLTDAFGDFAQGVLCDPRRTSKIHTMGGDPPTGYHTWYVFIRAMMLLGLDRHRWARIAVLDGYAWAVHTVARPNQKEVNPPLPESTVRQLRRQWLPRSVRRLDDDFLSFPYPPEPDGGGSA